MTWTMKNFKHVTSNDNMVAVVEPSIGRDITDTGDAINLALRFKSAQQNVVRAVRPFDRHSQLGAQFVCATRVVDMAMREKDFFNRDADLGDRRFNAVEIPTRIDHGANF